MPVPVGSPVCAMKPGDDAMEHNAVVELALHQRLDLRDVLGRPVGPQTDDNLAVLGRENDRIVGVFGGPRGGNGEKGKPERGASAECKHELAF